MCVFSLKIGYSPINQAVYTGKCAKRDFTWTNSREKCINTNMNFTWYFTHTKIFSLSIYIINLCKFSLEKNVEKRFTWKSLENHLSVKAFFTWISREFLPPPIMAKVMLSFVSVYLFVVCLQNNSKSRWWIITKLTGSVNHNKIIKVNFNFE